MIYFAYRKDYTLSEILQIPNFDSINIVENALLDADAACNQAIITLLNTEGIAVSDQIYVGQLGAETGEIKTILSISGKNITFTSNLSNNHRKYEPVAKLFGNQMKVYRTANVDGNIPADTSFSQIGSAINLDPDQTFTLFTDGSGGSDYWYKTTYFNSVTLGETSLAQSYATRGGGYGHYASVEDVRLEAGLQGATELDDSVFSARRDQAEDEINGRLAASGYTIPLQNASGTLLVPPIIENITRLLAAGYVLNQDYGPTTEGDTKNGDTKIKQARALLDEIQNKQIILLDVLGASLVNTPQVSGWPDDSTAIVGTDGTPEPFQMRMSKRF